MGRKLSDLQTYTIVSKGHKARNTDTTYYQIALKFSDDKNMFVYSET